MTDHLHPETIPYLSASLEEQILWLRKAKWTTYAQAEQLLSEISLIIKQPPNHRMPSMLLIGQTNSGKTMILEQALKRHPPTIDFKAEADCIPVVFVTMPPKPTLRSFYSRLLDHLGTLYKARAATSVLETQVITLLKNVGVHTIIIDELHNVIISGVRTLREFLNMIRFLSNECKISFIVAGTDSAARVIVSDNQLANRFRLHTISRWKDGNEFRKLLFFMEALIPLPEPSQLYKNDEIATLILRVGEATVGDMVEFINDATILALKQGDLHLNIEHFRKAGFISPTHRHAYLKELAGRSYV